jgi:hypothetical protein
MAHIAATAHTIATAHIIAHGLAIGVLITLFRQGWRNSLE